MSKSSNLAKKPSKAVSKLAAKPTGKVQKKSEKLKEKRSNWVKKLSRQEEDQLERAKQPLEGLGFIRRTLEELADEEEPSKNAVATKESLKHVSSKRGRKNARENEIEQFKLVMGHQMYRANPLGILQEHLTNTVKMQQKEASNLKQ